jgi:Ca2+-binding RTX toxin-like protein
MARPIRLRDNLHALEVERLETRRLLSVAISRGGTLYCTGTAGADTIVLVRDAKRAHRYDVIENGVGTRVNVYSFKRIYLGSGDGNDRITVDDSVGVVTARSITIDGGSGADRLQGGGGGSMLLGGVGDDTLVGGNAADYALGGDGQDQVWGGAGDDQLYGDAGNDSLYGQAGNDTLGGNGEDRLLFMGDNGDPDHLKSFPAAEFGDDLLNGGKGDDDLLCGTWSDDQRYDGRFDRPGSSTLIGGGGSDILNARGIDAADPIQTLADQQPNDLVPVQTYVLPPGAPEAVHLHIVLNIYIDGKLVALPTAMGEFASPVIHTHPQEANVVHFHDATPRTFQLKEAFAAWGISFDATHIGRYRVGDGHTLTMEVERQGRGPFVPNRQFGDYVIQSTSVEKGDRRDVINIRYT